MKLKGIVDTSKRDIKWLWDGKCYIISLVSIAITFMYVVGIWNFKQNSVAIIFTLAGIYMILSQLMLDARQFAHYKPNTFGNWFYSRPTTKSHNLIAAGLTTQISLGTTVHATVSISENATIEDKIAFLLRQTEYIQNALGKIEDSIKEADSKIISKANELKTDIENTNASLTKIIAGHAVGAYDVTFLGIILTVCGVLIQTYIS